MAAAQLPEFPPFTFLSFGRHVSDGDIGVPRLRRGVERQWRSEFLTAILSAICCAPPVVCF
jgi:hypothetical protein